MKLLNRADSCIPLTSKSDISITIKTAGKLTIPLTIVPSAIVTESYGDIVRLGGRCKSEAEYFIYFTYFDNETETDFKLIKNRGSNGLVGKELKGMDYLLMIQTENTDLIQSLKEVLNNLRIVQAVALISEKQLSERTKRILPF